MTLVFDEASGDPALYVEGSEPHPDPVRVGSPSHVWSVKPEHITFVEKLFWEKRFASNF